MNEPMFERRHIEHIYLQIIKKVKNFLLSEKSREFFIFLFFFVIAAGFWLLQTLNGDYETEFSLPVRLKEVPDNVVITSEPSSELRIRVKDKGTVLLNYMLSKSFYPIVLNFSDYKTAAHYVRIPSSQFEKKCCPNSMLQQNLFPFLRIHWNISILQEVPSEYL